MSGSVWLLCFLGELGYIINHAIDVCKPETMHFSRGEKKTLYAM